MQSPAGSLFLLVLCERTTERPNEPPCLAVQPKGA
jgi:hypothetical protein